MVMRTVMHAVTGILSASPQTSAVNHAIHVLVLPPRINKLHSRGDSPR